MQTTRLAFLAAACGGALCASAAASDKILADYDAPTLDRWMYPFNGSPGFKLDIAVFGATLLEGFDDKDAQFIVGFDTDADIEPGLEPDAYHPRSVVITATVSTDGTFVYDPSYDSFATHLDPADPLYLPDEDEGRPLTLHTLGYKPGWSVDNFEETSPFGESEIPPAQNGRNAFAQSFIGGQWVNVSNHIKDRFEAPPAALGQTADLAPPPPVPANTEFTFELDLCEPGVRDYVREALAAGRLNAAITSLHPATFGGDDVTYPRWYSKENPLALPPFNRTATLSLDVLVGDLGDFNADGEKNVLDFVAFQQAFTDQDPLADVDLNCQFNVLDFVAFQQAFTD